MTKEEQFERAVMLLVAFRREQLGLVADKLVSSAHASDRLDVYIKAVCAVCGFARAELYSALRETLEQP